MIVVVALGVLGLAFFYAKWSYGFYIDLNPDAPVNYEFTTNGTQICKNTDEAKAFL